MLSDLLAEAMARHDVPGASIAVAHGDDVVEAVAGVLDRDTGAPVTPDSLFHIGSVTKPWTATLVLQLVDEGAIDLDEPVVRYLPGFAVADPDATAVITTRHLLTHTAGFAGDLFFDTGDGDDVLDRYLDRIRTEAVQISPPGELFSYCNSGYCVLGALVATMRGTTWEAAARERLGGETRHIAFSNDEARAFTTATGHLPAGGDGPLATVDGSALPRSNAPAGSIMRATPRELVRFGRTLVKRAADMAQPQVAVPGAVGRDNGHWGLGLALWNWGGTRIFGHDGDVPGESTVLRVVPDHDLVVAMSIDTNAISGMFDDVVVPLLEVEPPARPVAPDPPLARDSSAFAGRYATPLWDYEVVTDGPAVIVKSTPKGLAAEMGRPESTDRYVPLAGDTFINGSETITFIDGGRYLHAGRAAPRISGA